tara:strand:- start:375 stop:1511 length:1137 start_codon:yes stop_codon:yes gene_type:complete
MSYKKLLIFLCIFGIFFEITSFVLSYFKFLPVSRTPKLYSKSTYYDSINEKNIWGAWRKQNHIIRHMDSCFDVSYKTNSYGAKDSEFIKEKKNQLKRAILLGDSFAEGIGVNNNNTLDTKLEIISNLEIYNFGSAGSFGPLQYYLIYENLAKQFEHDGIILTFLPANDFVENDYEFWKEKKWNLIDDDYLIERYRPYYVKKNNQFEYFIPKNAVKRDKWESLISKKFYYSLERFLKDNFWSLNFYYSFIYLKNYSIKNGREYSGFFDSKIEQQEAAIYFLEKIFNSEKLEFGIIVIIPTVEDLKRLDSTNNKLEDQYWFKKINNLERKLNYNFTVLNVSDYVSSIEDFKILKHQCDGHFNEKGNEFIAKLIYKHLIKD